MTTSKPYYDLLVDNGGAYGIPRLRASLCAIPLREKSYVFSMGSPLRPRLLTIRRMVNSVPLPLRIPLLTKSVTGFEPVTPTLPVLRAPNTFGYAPQKILRLFIC